MCQRSPLAVAGICLLLALLLREIQANTTDKISPLESLASHLEDPETRRSILRTLMIRSFHLDPLPNHRRFGKIRILLVEDPLYYRN